MTNDALAGRTAIAFDKALAVTAALLIEERQKVRYYRAWAVAWCVAAVFEAAVLWLQWWTR